MATSARTSPQSALDWRGPLIRRLRGKRTQAEFGRLLGVPKNTVWRWEAGAAAPDADNVRRLSRLAQRERFQRSFKVAGSLRVIGGSLPAPRGLARMILRSLERTARRLGG
jgi:transcriptional regulator with XRE-family HTH domain